MAKNVKCLYCGAVSSLDGDFCTSCGSSMKDSKLTAIALEKLLDFYLCKKQQKSISEQQICYDEAYNAVKACVDSGTSIFQLNESDAPFVNEEYFYRMGEKLGVKLGKTIRVEARPAVVNQNQGEWLTRQFASVAEADMFLSQNSHIKNCNFTMYTRTSFAFFVFKPKVSMITLNYFETKAEYAKRFRMAEISKFNFFFADSLKKGAKERLKEKNPDKTIIEVKGNSIKRGDSLSLMTGIDVTERVVYVALYLAEPDSDGTLNY